MRLKYRHKWSHGVGQWQYLDLAKSAQLDKVLSSLEKGDSADYQGIDYTLVDTPGTPTGYSGTRREAQRAAGLDQLIATITRLEKKKGRPVFRGELLRRGVRLEILDWLVAQKQLASGRCNGVRSYSIKQAARKSSVVQ